MGLNLDIIIALDSMMYHVGDTLIGELVIMGLSTSTSLHPFISSPMTGPMLMPRSMRTTMEYIRSKSWVMGNRYVVDTF